MILRLFSSRTVHPLADAKELKRILAEVPLDNAFKAVDELGGWVESLANADDFRIDQQFDVLRQLDDAAQPHLTRLARDYLNSPRLARAEEKRLWSTIYNYWEQVAQLGERCIARVVEHRQGDRRAEALKSQFPLLAARTVAALAQLLKWVGFRYGPVSHDLWRRLGSVYLAAETMKVAHKPLQLYPQMSGATTVTGEYLQALVFDASSMDTLMPLEIEIADRLIAHFLPGFEFFAEARPNAVYWVDAASEKGPMRMARRPQAVTPTLRFFTPGSVPQALAELILHVERGELPADLNLGGQYLPRTVLPVLRHLALYWAAQPPQRAHPRHAVKTRLSVLHGFEDSFSVFSGEFAGKEQAAESWVVENVSLGGFGAAVENLRGDWLRVGSLLSMQPEGGENWVLGIVRRFAKESETEASVGIQTLARRAQSVRLQPRAGSYAAASGVHGIRLPDEHHSGEVLLVLPIATFDLRESLEYIAGEQRFLLTPIEQVESCGDFELARYREFAED